MQFISPGLNRYHYAILELDLWELPQTRHTDTITANVERNFYSRCPPNNRPAHIHRLASDTSHSDLEPEFRKTESLNPVSEEKDDKPGNLESSKTEETAKYDESLFKALHHTFFKRIWVSAILLVISGKRKVYIFGMYCFFLKITLIYTSDTLKTTTPLLNQVILTWLVDSYVYFNLSDAERTATAISKPRGIGYGIGLAFALFVMQGYYFLIVCVAFYTYTPVRQNLQVW